MPADTDDRVRLLLAVTEHDSPAQLWQSAMRRLGGLERELVVLFVGDERWIKAATSPFTREVSFVSGRSQQFTRQRADEIMRERARRAQQELEQLAREAELSLRFEIAPVAGPPDLERLIGAARLTVLASRRLLQCSIYATLQALRSELLIVDDDAP